MRDECSATWWKEIDTKDNLLAMCPLVPHALVVRVDVMTALLNAF